MTDQMNSILEQTIMLQISRSAFGGTRKVNDAHVKVTRDEVEVDGVDVIRRLLPKSKELKAITNARGRFHRMVLDFIKVPSPFSRGVYAIPLAAVEQVEDRLLAYVAEELDLIDAFIEVYPAQMADALADPTSLAQSRDFPSVEDVADAFAYSWQWYDLGLGKLKTVSAKLYKTERAKQVAKAEEMFAEARVQLRSMLLLILQEFREKIFSETGEKKIFRNSVLDKVNAYLATFELRNLTDDAETQEIVTSLRQLTGGLTPDVMRSNEDYTQQMAQQVGDMAGTLEGLVAGDRAYNFEEEVA